MKKLLILFLLLISNFLVADEGMWLPYKISDQSLAEMQSLGLKLSKEQLFSLNTPSLKDAIVQFGGGCTGEIISPNGLLLTNHHCGIGQVQAHSSVEHDYLNNGFWAYTLNEELPNEGLRVSFLSYVEDVTDLVLKNVLDNFDEDKRYELIKANINDLVNERKSERNVNVEVIPFYHGNQYVLFEYNVYSDVRLVACPPWGIGKYGADTDNWTWPRHKGDFCIFRVYTAADGSPANYSKYNIPMKSKYYLPISAKGIEDNDYAMILGYPGSTDRYSSSQTVKIIIEQQGPSLVKCRSTKLDIYRKHMDADPKVFIQYASKQASVSNYWKYYIGQVKQLKRNHVVEKKESQEKEFLKWVNAYESRMKMYGSVLDDFQKVHEVLSKYQSAITYHIEAGLRGSEAITFAMSYIKINNDIKKKENIEVLTKKLLDNAETFFKNYDVNLDRNVTIALLSMFHNDIPKELQPKIISEIGNGDFTKFVDNAFKKSIFTDQNKLNAWLKNPKKIEKDPIFDLMNSIRDSYFKIRELTQEAEKMEEKAARLYMKALMEMYPDNNFYPDANFTMRLTYGKIASYKSSDAVNFDYYTTIDGVLEKYVPDNWEFDLPKAYLELYNSKDFGDYVDKNGNLVVNFITTNDITGGNSGSPVIDAEGNLIGLAFDGNWEAMSGDLSFEENVQRTIAVDARYLLFVIEKIGKAVNLIEEMTIIK